MTNRRLRAVGAALVILTVVPAVAARTRRPRALELSIELSARQVEIVASEPLERFAPPIDLQPPGALLATTAQGTYDRRELVVATYTKRGRLIGAWGYPAVGLTFLEGGDEDSGYPAETIYPANHERTIQIPLAADATYLFVGTYSRRPLAQGIPAVCDRSDCMTCDWNQRPGGPTVTDPPELGAVPTAASVYPLVDDRIDQRGSRAPVTFDRPFERAPRISMNRGCLNYHYPLFTTVIFTKPCVIPDGYVDGAAEVLYGNSQTVGRFDVVIVGDGFTLAEMPELRTWADRLKTELLAREPFHRLQSLVNVHLVRTVSTESGITGCPAANTSKTFFEVHDTEPDASVAVYEMPDHCRVRAALDAVGHRRNIELVALIAHCSQYGGKAEPWLRLEYVSAYTPEGGRPAVFEPLAMHEAGHALAWLGEEHVPCATPNPYYPFPTYRANVAPGSYGDDIWWKDLRDRDAVGNTVTLNETSSSGGFRAVHTCNDSFSDAALCEPTFPDAQAMKSMLGRYWGAYYGQRTGTPNQCRVFCGQDLSGNTIGTADCDYFRPAWTCRMRDKFVPYCRACEEKICERIRTAAPSAVCALP